MLAAIIIVRGTILEVQDIFGCALFIQVETWFLVAVQYFRFI
jgi:hypothetical protein